MNIWKTGLIAKQEHSLLFCFYCQRGLSTGISVFAPSIILSSLLGLEYLLDQSFYGWSADHLYHDGRRQSSGLYTAIAIDHHFYRNVPCCLYGSKYASCRMLVLLMH